MNSLKFSGFKVLKATYKTVNGHDIAAYVLVPRGISSGKHPVAVRFHGGGLVSLVHSFPFNILKLTE
jgi:cephalosporin-C deacetylase-like acetyl esterase